MALPGPPEQPRGAPRRAPGLLELGALCLDSDIVLGFTSHLLRRRAKVRRRGRGAGRSAAWRRARAAPIGPVPVPAASWRRRLDRGAGTGPRRAGPVGEAWRRRRLPSRRHRPRRGWVRPGARRAGAGPPHAPRPCVWDRSCGCGRPWS
ncbi:unnamed protein product [Pipistrellus nathusii]|uniref:Uncharacterized protein n=1 Tax=Pipistrellus nathusii TaxID=59473 RepID=A0ABN9Z0J9_PIPNA